MVRRNTNDPLNYLGVRAPTPPNFIRERRAPETSDVSFELGTIWLDEVTKIPYILVAVSKGSATWDPYASGGGSAAFSPFIVGIGGTANFQTIQSALDAANAAGGGTVVVQDGTFTEDLILYDKVSIFGTSILGTIIVGTHIPPVSGSMSVTNCEMQGSTAIISSTAAGTADLLFYNCRSQVNPTEDSFVLPNWTGSLSLFNFTTLEDIDGLLTSSAAMNVTIDSSNISTAQMGLFGTLSMTGGTLTIRDSIVSSALNLAGNTQLFAQGATLSIIAFVADSFGEIIDCNFESGTGVGIIFNTTGNAVISNTTITTSGAQAINGTGTGVLTLISCNFPLTSAIDSAVILESTLGTSRSVIVQTKQLTTIVGGPDDSSGFATLVGGTVTVLTTRTFPASRIFLTSQADGGIPGFLRISARVTGVSFTILSSSGTDTSQIGWFIVQPV